MSESTTLYKHPTYIAMAPDWERLGDMYKGDHDTMVKPIYLVPHTQELVNDAEGISKQMRAARELRTRYMKIPEIIVSLWTSFFFRKPYQLDQETVKLFQLADGSSAENNIDGNGTSLSKFLQKFTEIYLTFGKSTILVDSFNIDVGTKNQEVGLNIRPYMELVKPLAIPDWDIETADPARVGQFNFLRHEFDIIKPRARSSDEIERVRVTNELYLENGIYKIARFELPLDKNGIVKTDPKDKSREATWTLIKEVTTKLQGEIPVAMLDDETWIDGVCEETFRFHNLRSSKDSVEYAQGFQKIFISGDGLTNTESIKAITEHVISLLPAGATVQGLEPVSTDGLDRSITQALENAFKVGLNQLRQVGADSKETQAADAIQMEKDNTYALCESTLKDLENVFNTAIRHYARFKGIEGFTGKLVLNKEIKDEDINQFLTTYNSFRDRLVKYNKLSKAIDKKVVGTLNLSDEELEAAKKEIDAASLEKPQDNPNDPIIRALNGNAGA